MSEIPEKGGTYLLVMRSEREGIARIGNKLGTLHYQRGYYYYIGSAFGSGGVGRRTAHHRQFSKRPHWHIDYLRHHLLIVEIWYSLDPEHREHLWAECLAGFRGVSIPLKGFGSSDCSCETHLFYSKQKRSFNRFRRDVRSRVTAHKPFYHFINA